MKNDAISINLLELLALGITAYVVVVVQELGPSNIVVTPVVLFGYHVQ